MVLMSSDRVYGTAIPNIDVLKAELGTPPPSEENDLPLPDSDDEQADETPKTDTVPDDDDGEED